MNTQEQEREFAKERQSLHEMELTMSAFEHRSRWVALVRQEAAYLKQAHQEEQRYVQQAH